MSNSSTQDSRMAMRVTFWVAVLFSVVSICTRSADGASDRLPAEQAEPSVQGEALEDKLGEVEQRLRDTSAIGALTKLSLKSELESLLEAFSRLHLGGGEDELPHLMRRFDLLLAKTLDLLRSQDPALFQLLADIRPDVLAALSHPNKYAQIFGHREAARDVRSRR